jgi:nickel transport protein
MVKKALVFCVFVLIFILSIKVSAHDVWIEKKGNEFVVLYGHRDKHDPYDPSKIKEVMAYDSNGNPITVEVIRQKDTALLSPKGKASAITLFFDNGYWVKTTDGWKNISKRDAKGMQLVEPARHSLKYAKILIQWAERFTKPLGMKLEIVPTKNPFLLKKGEYLLVTVFYEGKPLEGAKIETGYHKELAKTDKNGMASVPVESGINVIVANHLVPIKDNPNADIISLSSTLTFEVR